MQRDVSPCMKSLEVYCGCTELQRHVVWHTVVLLNKQDSLFGLKGSSILYIIALLYPLFLKNLFHLNFTGELKVLMSAKESGHIVVATFYKARHLVHKIELSTHQNL